MEFFDQYILIPGTAFGDLQVRYYGIIIVVAMLVAATVAASLAARNKMDPDHIWGGLTWAIFPGIIFARLWFILFPPVSLTAGCDTATTADICQNTAWYLENFFNLNGGAIAVWTGGLYIFGAVIGGMLGAWLYIGPLHNPIAKFFHIIFLPITIPISFVAWAIVWVYRRIRGQEIEPYRIPQFESTFPNEGLMLTPWLDIAAIALPLAQAIGRWANYINQELYGMPTNLPWGITIDAEHRVGEYASIIEHPVDTTFHPLFLYESLWNFAAFLVLYNLYTRYRDRFKRGDFFLIYIAQYSFVRFFLEFIRIEKAYLPGTDINSSQVFTAAVFVIALVIFFVRRASNAPTYGEIAKQQRAAFDAQQQAKQDDVQPQRPVTTEA